MAKFIRITNWEQFQHYKDRNPPWIKLHRELLTSRTWVNADDASRVLAIACMVLAAETGNKIPLDPQYILRRAYLNQDPDFGQLVASQFIEIVDETGNASTPLARASDLHTNARPETETETEKRQRREKRSGVETPALPTWLPRESWDGFVEMRNKKREPLTSRAISLIFKKLKELQAAGDEPGAVLDQSTCNNWKSVFPLKGTQNNATTNRAEQRQQSNIDAARRATVILQRRMANNPIPGSR